MIGSMLSLYNLFIEPDFSFTLIYTVPVFGTTTNNNYRRLILILYRFSNEKGETESPTSFLFNGVYAHR